MTDRRRINAPSGGTAPPVFARVIKDPGSLRSLRPTRQRVPNELRKIFLQTSLVPSVSGSAFLELQHPLSKRYTAPKTLLPARSSLKLSATVHGPKPLHRSAPFTPQLILTTHVKFAPFGSRRRRGYVRDATERDLGAHLETALRGVVIADRWPKSGVEVVVTVLEAEEGSWWGDEDAWTGSGAMGDESGWGMMSVLAGCVTVAAAALADAGIDCVDLVAGGVAAVVRDSNGSAEKGKSKEGEEGGKLVAVLDPCPSEHREIVAACVVAYMSERDEITELWMKGDVGDGADDLINRAVEAAVASRAVMAEAIKETIMAQFPEVGRPATAEKPGMASREVEMTG